VNFLSNLNDLRVNSTISSNQYLSEGQTPGIITGNQATESHSEITAGSSRSTTVTNVLVNYQYQWQTRIKYPLTWSNMNYYFSLYGWTDIPNATEINYTPPKTDRSMEYRRLILEKPGDKSISRRCATSNVINIVPIYNDTTKNIICCDQTVSPGDVVNTIDGASSFGSSDYQWLVSQDGINWEEIYGANNRNYIPVRIESGSIRGSNTTENNQTLFYRRLIFNFLDDKYYTSNIIKINFLARNGTLVSIYPNPTTSILNLESARVDLANAKISIVNLAGNLIIPNNYQIINSNLVVLDVSNFLPGPYFINIQTAVRNYQYNFIKK